MPYKRVGKCVYKENPDGSRGKKVGCSDSEEKAKAYMKKLYMEEDKSLVSFSMHISKAAISDKTERTMRLSMVNSDTGEDVFEERMSVELFNDFIARIANNAPVPPPFDVVCEDGWTGGMPYLSISHYKSGGGKNIPGDVEKLYLDGEKLKSTSVLHESPMGLAVWKAVCKDFDDANKPIEERSYENPVRVSIGFLDLEHKHEVEDDVDFVFTRTELNQKCPKCAEGINGKVYLKGQLVHLAFTRVPANTRTSVEVLRMSDEIETKKQDAESIIGDLANELVGKSVVEDDALVVKADDGRDAGVIETPAEEEVTMEETITEESVVEETPEDELIMEEPVVEEPQKSKVELAVESFLSKLAEVQEKGVVGEDAAKVLQPFMNEMATATKEAINPAQPLTREDMIAAMKAAIPDIVSQVLKSLPASVPASPQPEIPQPRSLVLEKSAPQSKELTQIEMIARNSMRLAQP